MSFIFCFQEASVSCWGVPKTQKKTYYVFVCGAIHCISLKSWYSKSCQAKTLFHSTFFQPLQEELLRQLQRAEELAIGRSEVFRWNCAKTKEVRRDRDRLASAKQAHLRKVKCEAQWRNEVRIRHAQEATQVHGCIAHHAMQEHDELQAVLTQLKARTAYDPPHSCWAHPLPG